MPSFDWYQATVPAEVPDLLEALSTLSDGPADVLHGRGHHGYAHETRLQGSDGPIARVWHGGTHQRPHVVLSGDIAHAGAQVVRQHWPEHKPTRVDSAEDWQDPVFDRIQQAMLEVASIARVKVDTRGDHLLTKEGRTVYLGAPSSAVRLRLYDKAAELRSKFASDPIRLSQVPEHLVRLEAQVRPAGDLARRSFATIQPEEVMGSASWLRDVWSKVTGLEAQPVQARKLWRQSDDDRAWAHMLAQYGPLLERKKQEQGDWACVGLQIGSDLAQRSKAKRGLGQRPRE